MTLIEFLKAGNQIKANWNVISSYTRTVSVDDLDDEEHPLTKLDDIVNNAIDSSKEIDSDFCENSDTYDLYDANGKALAVDLAPKDVEKFLQTYKGQF